MTGREYQPQCATGTVERAGRCSRPTVSTLQWVKTEAEVSWPPYQEGIFRPKDKADNAMEYDRIYCTVIYLQEDWVGADRRPAVRRRLFSATRPITVLFL